MSNKGNLIANVGGRVWAALMSFAFVPFYVKFMGIEAFGLVGFFTSLLAILFVLDLGFSTTLNREMARLGASPGGVATARQLLRTLEIIYWCIGVVICIVVVLAAPLIARRWLNIGTLPIGEAIFAIRLMGVMLMLRWPVSLYQGALMGLRRHVSMNVVMAIMAALQGGGAVLILWLVSPTITAFFSWQIVVAAVQIGLLALLAWRYVPLPGHRARFSFMKLRPVLGFSAGIMGITLLSVVLTQLDKVLLSKTLPLAEFGYYALASTMAAVLTTAAGAIYGAIFPALAQLVAAGRESEVAMLYHKSCQILSLMIIPAGIALALFSRDLLAIYTGNAVVTDNTWLVFSLLVIGNMLLAIMMLPLALQLAFGWTNLSLYKNVLAVVLFVPLLLFLVHLYGKNGAGIAWIALVLGYFLIEIPVMHRRLLPAEKWPWYLTDIGIPAAISLGVIGAARLLMPDGMGPVAVIAIVAIAGAVALACSLLALPFTRSQLRLWWARMGGGERAAG